VSWGFELPPVVVFWLGLSDSGFLRLKDLSLPGSCEECTTVLLVRCTFFRTYVGTY
jgi:hypothetical protein